MKNGTISLLEVTGDGENALLSGGDFGPPGLHYSLVLTAPRLNARRTPASLVSPQQTSLAVQVRHENLRIQTLSSLNHSPTSHLSLMVSPRQTVLCRSGLARNTAAPLSPLDVPFHIKDTNAGGDHKLRLPGEAGIFHRDRP